MGIKGKLRLLNTLIVIAGSVVAVVVFFVSREVSDAIENTRKKREILSFYKGIMMDIQNESIAIRNLIFDPEGEDSINVLKRTRKVLYDKGKRLKGKILPSVKSEEEKKLIDLLYNLIMRNDEAKISIIELIEFGAVEEAKEVLTDVESKIKSELNKYLGRANKVKRERNKKRGR